MKKEDRGRMTDDGRWLTISPATCGRVFLLKPVVPVNSRKNSFRKCTCHIDIPKSEYKIQRIVRIS